MGLDWDRDKQAHIRYDRAAQLGAEARADREGRPPTAKQIRFIRSLQRQLGIDEPMPPTRFEANGRISRLLDKKKA